MDSQQTYWLEELKQSDKKIEQLESAALELIKFYFLTLFSIITVVFTLYNYKIINGNERWFFVIFLPPFIFGIVTVNTLKKIFDQYAIVETNRNQISEWFIWGEVKNNFKLGGTPFSSFYTLISWLVTINTFVAIYFAVPFFRSVVWGVAVLILVGIAVAGILSTVVLVSLNGARLKARDARRKSDIAQIRLALEMFHDKNGGYPIANSFVELLPLIQEYIGGPISDPFAEKGWIYEYSSADGLIYRLGFTLEGEGKREIVSEENL